MTISSFAVTDLLGTLNEVEQKNAPKTLYLSGDDTLLRQGRRVSVVGSRNASPDGLKRARILTKALVKDGITVVSGLARGIDTVAHTTAIECGGRTISVLGTPLDQVYPPENADLHACIVRDHLSVSQFSSGTPMQRQNWPRRNRTMALLTDATVIVEAREKSGTLHQGWEALRLGRWLWIMESATLDPNLSWPAEMIKYGAQVLTRDNLDIFLEEVPERTHIGQDALVF